MNRKLAGGLLALLLTATATPVLASEAGSGGIGIRGGTLFFTQDEDLKEFGMPRISGDLVFSYSWSDRFTADVTIGWGWNRLDTGSDSFYIANIVPLFPIGARYMISEGTMRPFIGGGGGLYNWSILSEDLGAAKDPVTYERLRRVDFGVYGIAGVERTMSKHITMMLDGSYTHIFAADEVNFPSGFNGDKAYFAVRLGATFWFSLSERIDTGLPD